MKAAAITYTVSFGLLVMLVVADFASGKSIREEQRLARSPKSRPLSNIGRPNPDMLGRIRAFRDHHQGRRKDPRGLTK